MPKVISAGILTLATLALTAGCSDKKKTDSDPTATGTAPASASGKPTPTTPTPTPTRALAGASTAQATLDEIVAIHTKVRASIISFRDSCGPLAEALEKSVADQAGAIAKINAAMADPRLGDEVRALASRSAEFFGAMEALRASVMHCDQEKFLLTLTPVYTLMLPPAPATE